MTAGTPSSLHLDQEAGTAYLRLSDNAVVRTIEHTDDVAVDLDEHDVVIGVEILNLTTPVDLDGLSNRFHIRTEAMSVLLNALDSSSTKSVSTRPGSNNVESHLRKT